MGCSASASTSISTVEPQLWLDPICIADVADAVDKANHGIVKVGDAQSSRSSLTMAHGSVVDVTGGDHLAYLRKDVLNRTQTLGATPKHDQAVVASISIECNACGYKNCDPIFPVGLTSRCVPGIDKTFLKRHSELTRSPRPDQFEVDSEWVMWNSIDSPLPISDDVKRRLYASEMQAFQRTIDYDQDAFVQHVERKRSSSPHGSTASSGSSTCSGSSSSSASTGIFSTRPSFEALVL